MRRVPKAFMRRSAGADDQSTGSGVPMVSRMGFVNDRFSRSLPFASGAIGALVLMLGMTACQKEEKAAAPNIRPVRTVTVEPSEAGETVSLTGEIKPRYEADIG